MNGKTGVFGEKHHQSDAASALIATIKTRWGVQWRYGVKLPTKLVGRVRGKATHTRTEEKKRGGGGRGGRERKRNSAHTYTHTHTSTYTHKTHERTLAHGNCTSLSI